MVPTFPVSVVPRAKMTANALQADPLVMSFCVSPACRASISLKPRAWSAGSGTASRRSSAGAPLIVTTRDKRHSAIEVLIAIKCLEFLLIRDGGRRARRCHQQNQWAVGSFISIRYRFREVQAQSFLIARHRVHAQPSTSRAAEDAEDKSIDYLGANLQASGE